MNRAHPYPPYDQLHGEFQSFNSENPEEELPQDVQGSEDAEETATATAALAAWHIDDPVAGVHGSDQRLSMGFKSPYPERESERTPAHQEPSNSDQGERSTGPRRRVKQWLKCPGCDKSFERLSAIKQHLLTHTGERPHVCGACSRRFTINSNLKRHHRTCKVLKKLLERKDTAALPPLDALSTADPGFSHRRFSKGDDWSVYRARSGSSNGESTLAWSLPSDSSAFRERALQQSYGTPALGSHGLEHRSVRNSILTPISSSPPRVSSHSTLSPGSLPQNPRDLALGPASFRSSMRPSHNIGPRIPPIRTASLPSMARDSAGRLVLGSDYNLSPSIPFRTSTIQANDGSPYWRSEPHAYHRLSPRPPTFSARGQIQRSALTDYSPPLFTQRQSIATDSLSTALSDFPGLAPSNPEDAEPPLRAPDRLQGREHSALRQEHSDRPYSWGVPSDIHRLRLPPATSLLSTGEEFTPSSSYPPWVPGAGLRPWEQEEGSGMER